MLAWRKEIRLNLDKFFTSLLFQARVLLIRICQKQTKLRGQLFQSTRDSTFSTSLVSHHFSNKFKLIYNWCGDHYWEILHQKKWSGLKMWLLWYWLAVDRGWWWVDGRRRRRVMERGVVRHTGVGPHWPHKIIGERPQRIFVMVVSVEKISRYEVSGVIPVLYKW